MVKAWRSLLMVRSGEGERLSHRQRETECSGLQCACLAGLRAHLKFVAMNLKW